MSKKSEAEKRRLKRLKKDMDSQQKKLDSDKKKFQAQKTNFIKQQKAFEIEKKAFQAAKAQLEKQKRKAGKSKKGGYGGLKSPRSGGVAGAKVKKLEIDLKDTKDKLEKRSKEVRTLRKEVNSLNQEIEALKRQLKKAGRGKKAPTDNKKLKQLQREIANLRKRLRMALRDLDKQSRYYNAQLRKFKDDQNKWLRKQRDLAKNKKIVVKYVFIDDIKKIKVYKKGRKRIKIRTREGGEVVVRDVEVIEATDIEEENADEIDKEVEAIEKEFKKRRKKKRTKSVMIDGKEVEIVEEYEDDGEDDIDEEEENKDEEEPDITDNSEEHYEKLIDELNSRTRDLHNINVIYENEVGDDIDKGLKELLENVIDRHKKWTEKLKELKFDNIDELPDINKKWQDEIYKLREIVEKRRLKRIKEIEELEQKMENQKGNKNNDAKYLKTSQAELLKELSGRIEDLNELNNIYFNNDESSEKDKSKSTQALIKDVTKRHNKINGLLENEDGGDNDISSIMIDNNDQWKNLIIETIDGNDKTNPLPLKNELKQRTKELEEVIKVLNNEKPKSSLKELLLSISQRHQKIKDKKAKNIDNDNDDKKEDDDDDENKDNDNWKNLIEKLSKAKPKQDLSKVKENTMKDYIIKNLLDEMEKRKKDLETLKELTRNDDIPEEEFENVKQATSERHLKQKKDIKNALDNKFKNDKSKPAKTIIEAIDQDNNQWQTQLKKLTEEARNTKNLKDRNKYYLEELEGRITDLIKVEDIYDKSITKGKSKDAKSSLKSLVSNVKDRQDNIENEMKDALKKSNNKKADIKSLENYSQNDDDWRDAIKQISTKIADNSIDYKEKKYDKPLPKKKEEKKDEKKTNKDEKKETKEEKKEKKDETKIDENKEDENIDDEYDPNEEVQSIWWLDKDKDRRKEIDKIKVSKKQENKLNNLGDYLERVLSNATEDAITPLYAPLPKKDNHHILSTFYDGFGLLQLMNQIRPGYIDMRAVNKPDPFNPYPLSDKQIEENISLVLSGARGLGINLNKNGNKTQDWFDKNKNANMLIDLVSKLHEKKINEIVNPENNNALLRLTKDGEEKDDIDKKTGSEWLNRWMNNALDNKLDDEVKDQKDTLYKTLNKVTNNDFKNNDKSFDTNSKKNSKDMINYGNKKLGIQTEYDENDLNNNNKMVEELFAAEVFQNKSGLKPLTSDEKKKYKSLLQKDTGVESSFESWINSLLPAQFHIANLYREMSDGIVLCRILDKIKPGCINWKKKKVKLNIKNKFDKLNNCNYALNIVKKDFPTISLVNMSGSDFVDSNQKFIHTLLWQLMRYHATKKLSELSFGGKDVKDEDIIQWANLTIDNYEDKQSKKLKSLRDKTLTTCIFYSELLKSINNDAVDIQYVNYDVYPLKNSKSPDRYKNERLDNARYAMTCCRKLGGDLFIMPEDLASMDTKAVLSMLASIMTIAFTKKDNKKNNKNDDDIQKVLSGK